MDTGCTDQRTPGTARRGPQPSPMRPRILSEPRYCREWRSLHTSVARCSARRTDRVKLLAGEDLSFNEIGKSGSRRFHSSWNLERHTKQVSDPVFSINFDDDGIVAVAEQTGVGCLCKGKCVKPKEDGRRGVPPMKNLCVSLRPLRTASFVCPWRNGMAWPLSARQVRTRRARDRLSLAAQPARTFSSIHFFSHFRRGVLPPVNASRRAVSWQSHDDVSPTPSTSCLRYADRGSNCPTLHQRLASLHSVDHAYLEAASIGYYPLWVLLL